MVDQHFPRTTVTSTQGEKPYFTEELRKLRRQRDRSYQQTGKSQRYVALQQKFQLKLKAEALKYKNKIMLEVQEGKRGSGYTAIRRLGEGPAENTRNKQFRIPAYVEEGLTPLQSANRLADFFSAISQTVEPLELGNFHPRLRLAIEEGRINTNKPVLTQHEVYRSMLKIKKTKLSCAG